MTKMDSQESSALWRMWETARAESQVKQQTMHNAIGWMVGIVGAGATALVVFRALNPTVSENPVMPWAAWIVLVLAMWIAGGQVLREAGGMMRAGEFALRIERRLLRGGQLSLDPHLLWEHGLRYNTEFATDPLTVFALLIAVFALQLVPLLLLSGDTKLIMTWWPIPLTATVLLIAYFSHLWQIASSMPEGHVSPAGDGKLRFPDGFLWGAATSAHQVEGGNSNNDWARFEAEGKVDGGQVSGAAAEQWSRWRTDFDLAKELGHSAHRLSIEWSRVEPEEGVYDSGAVTHYRDELMYLRSQGLATFVTLHHFTLPLWLADQGGWTKGTTPRLFELYARHIATELWDVVDFWIPVNEPNVYVYEGCLLGNWPPEQRSLWAAWRTHHNMILGHRAAYGAIHDLDPQSHVGTAMAMVDYRPRNNSSVADRSMASIVRWFADWAFMDAVKDDADFIGVQYYRPLSVDWGGVHPAGDLPQSDVGWEVSPRGLYQVVVATSRRYQLPIYITENGVADADDSLRPSFIAHHLKWLHASIEEGADVRGYLHWSLIDNFEWRKGFTPRFGLVAVDFDTQQRVPRPSARSLARIAGSNALDAESVRMHLDVDEHHAEGATRI